MAVVVVVAALAIVGIALAAARPEDGLYAEAASRTIGPHGESNGGVDLVVTHGGTKLEGGLPGTGMSCSTGAEPPAGIPSYDELTIKLPRDLPISADGSFSFSGPVTLGPEQTQEEELTIHTTYRISGRFKAGRHGTWTATGTDYSPVCQPTTLKKFTASYDPGAE
jgi:hypothetical protein